MAIETLFTTPVSAPSAGLQTLFNGAVPGPAPLPAAAKPSASTVVPYKGAEITRLSGDWIGQLLSPDLEIRRSLAIMRGRCRKLANNNDYVARFINLVKQNVVGPNGILLEVQLPEGKDALAEPIEDEIERSWRAWCKKKNCTVSRQMSFKDVLGVVLETLVIDGECFIRKVKGFPGNPYRYALQLLDADLFDANFNLPPRALNVTQNEIRMSVEVDGWGAPVAYWAWDRHPSEGGARRIPIPADEIIHLYVIRRGNQTRGIPFLHTAMARLNMTGGYEEAVLVGARTAACKMAYVTSKTGEEYTGARDKNSGAVEVTVEPGSIDQLPEGMSITPLDWNYPQVGVDEFVKLMLRGVAAGINCSYSSLTGDLRDVNFSSIRQGVLDERDGWRVLQTFAIEGACEPVFEGWLPMALTTNQVRVPMPPSENPELYLDAATWRPRGWTWVDPLKDVQAAIAARRAGMGTLAQAAQQQGCDWRDTIDQIAAENDYALKKGVFLDFSTQAPNRDNQNAATDGIPRKGGGAPGGDGGGGE